MKKENAWLHYGHQQTEEIERFSREYRGFIDAGKTERECVEIAVEAAKQRGFKPLERNQKLTPGDRVYKTWMDKSIVLFVIGSAPMEEGMLILGAHIDSPRIDIKQNPLYENSGIAYFDTQYYGGIKKYQWLALPLALHGVVAKTDGSVIKVCIGEDESEPTFGFSDLLPHLADDQMKKSAEDFIDGEALNLIIGSKPAPDEKENAVAKAVLAILKEKYDIDEEDFYSAELEAVPAGKSRDFGFDRSMIIGYGHDDRVCAYPSMAAILDYSGTPEKTLCCILTDKEEIGSVGATGMRSHYFENIVSEAYAGTCAYSELGVKRALYNSRMLSSDVNAAYDPDYAAAYEKNNAAEIGCGVCFTKYTGGSGKHASSDANAEFIAWLRRVMNDAGVNYQFSAFGKVDLGGGGTIAYMCAKYGMNVIDCGVPVLSMHAPYELISKADLYEAYRCYAAFLNA